MRFLLSLLLIFSFPALSQELSSVVREATRVLDSVNPSPSDFIPCNDPPVANSLAEVNARTTRGQGGCGELEVGRHREMSRQAGYRSGHYLLRRLDQNRYAAVLNLEFYAGAGATPQLVESMKARTMNCLRGMQPLLRNGNETLEIQVISPEDRLNRGIPRPEKNRIEVTPQRANYRGDAGHYGSNFTCRTIGHEILHLIGLCDEYHEGIKKEEVKDNEGRVTSTRYLDWSCRPVTSTQSFMRNIYAFDEIVPQEKRCDCGPECQRLSRAPEEIRNMFLSADGDHFINTEMSLMGTHIDSIRSSGEVHTEMTTPPFCSTTTGALGANERPPVMKSFHYEGERDGTYSFITYRPRHNEGALPHENFYWFGWTRYTCNCSGDTRNFCRRLVENIIERSRNLPPRMTCPIDVTSGSNVNPVLAPQTQPSGLDDTVDPPQLVLRTNGNGQSLLRPQQFERIKAGDCRNGPATPYETCEEFAYRGRNPARSDYYMSLPTDNRRNQCAELPAQCNNDSFILDGVRGQ